MGYSILELVLRRLREDGFTADIAFPGQKFPQIDDAVAAVHIERVDRANLEVTVEISIICPASMGGTACEVKALRATEVLRWSGAVCVQNGCTYDGIAQVYVVSVLATFTGMTEAEDCTVWPGFYCYVNDQLHRFVIGFTGVQEDGVEAESLTFMMQKEVADRIQSAPGKKTYGAVSVAVQYYCEAEILSKVPRDVFIPQPNVDSAVLKLTVRKEKAVEVEDRDIFLSCIKAGFGQRRKTLLNSLMGVDGMTKDGVKAALEGAGIEPSRRAETLNLEEFATLANQVYEQLQGTFFDNVCVIPSVISLLSKCDASLSITISVIGIKGYLSFRYNRNNLNCRL